MCGLLELLFFLFGGLLTYQKLGKVCKKIFCLICIVREGEENMFWGT